MPTALPKPSYWLTRPDPRPLIEEKKLTRVWKSVNILRAMSFESEIGTSLMRCCSSDLHGLEKSLVRLITNAIEGSVIYKFVLQNPVTATNVMGSVHI